MHDGETTRFDVEPSSRHHFAARRRKTTPSRQATLLPGRRRKSTSGAWPLLAAGSCAGPGICPNTAGRAISPGIARGGDSRWRLMACGDGIIDELPTNGAQRRALGYFTGRQYASSH